MVDPKRVELTGYNGLPHLVAPVVVEMERIIGVLRWVTTEMDERYKKFSRAGARNIIDYNSLLDPDLAAMPYIVVIIDELADLMMMAPDDTERAIARIAALAGLPHSPRDCDSASIGGCGHRAHQGELPGAHRLCRSQQRGQPRHHRPTGRRTPAGQGRHALPFGRYTGAATGSRRARIQRRDKADWPLLETAEERHRRR